MFSHVTVHVYLLSFVYKNIMYNSIYKFVYILKFMGIYDNYNYVLYWFLITVCENSMYLLYL